MKVVAFITRMLKAVTAAVVAGSAAYSQNQDWVATVGAALVAGLAVWAVPNSGG